MLIVAFVAWKMDREHFVRSNVVSPFTSTVICLVVSLAASSAARIRLVVVVR